MEANQNQQNQAQMTQRQQITAKEFASKYNSKREVFNMLAVDAQVYLPDYSQVTIYFLKDLLNGKKKCKWHRHRILDDLSLIDIKGHEVAWIQVPQYE